ncbi:hypothetical protein ACIRP2_10355 [Streptomyces sp. NPDC101194]|uniref:hypothetical protein n=1 Tax=Streptomyces sp. NPDC101194 TaxID=3366127 RepID=UPI0037F4AD70
MIINGAFRFAAATLLILTATAGCAESTSRTPAGASAAASTPASGPATAAPSTPTVAEPATTARDGARQFAQALARGDTALACGLADARLRSYASTIGGSCSEALAELATDDRYVFTQTACVNAPNSYKAGGDPQDTPDSVRVDIDCAEGYTWLRVDRVGSIWRVTEFNAP